MVNKMCMFNTAAVVAFQPEYGVGCIFGETGRNKLEKMVRWEVRNDRVLNPCVL